MFLSHTHTHTLHFRFSQHLTHTHSLKVWQHRRGGELTHFQPVETYRLTGYFDLTIDLALDHIQAPTQTLTENNPNTSRADTDTSTCINGTIVFGGGDFSPVSSGFEGVQ